MNTKKEINKKIDELNNEFNNLASNDDLNINTIEGLMIDNLESYKQILTQHVEDLLISSIDEKKLIVKKNKNGQKKDIV